IIPEKKQARSLVTGRKLTPLKLNKFQRTRNDIYIQEMNLDKAWVRPGEMNRIILIMGPIRKEKRNISLRFFVRNFKGDVVKELSVSNVKEWWGTDIDTKDFPEGGYILEAELYRKGSLLDKVRDVFTVAREIADDIRYGFYANWDRLGTDYNKKTSYFLKLHINAIEYYDYFPAHGLYAPREKVYRFEPFGGKNILARDIQYKMNAAYDCNILSLAYIAAYAASGSVYQRYPYPMTDRKGDPRIFNGSVMTEPEARAQKKPVWFHLMAIAPDTKWYSYIMPELKRTIDNSPGDLVAFDGFEIDSYGHSPDEMYYSKGSSYSGRLLSFVLKGFVRDVRDMARRGKNRSAVTFNCVNEYGIRDMYDAVDFLFIENWAGHQSSLEGLTDICYSNRKPFRQRVVLKLYPADMEEGLKYWPAVNLKYILAASLSGGGTIMAAGEPDERHDRMHGLNTLYYPDNTAMPAENFDILRRYYTVDSLLYRLNHGKNVENTDTELSLPGCYVRAFRSLMGPGEEYTVILIQHTGKNIDWNRKLSGMDILKNYETALKIRTNVKPKKVYYCSPDFEELLYPQVLDWEWKDGYVRTLLPRLDVSGILIIQM
ncbi:MAG: glycoside hydrolase family 66 protein, partial [bacterium]|nr:glycoside hydrolase family 66 protein [bacterium]